MVTAVVFDMDGTLVDSTTVIPDAYISVIRSLGGPAYEREDIVAAYHVGPPEAMLTHLLGRPARPEEVDAYHDRLAALAPGGVTVYPGVAALLDALRALVPLAVFTGASILACRILLGAAGLLERFTTLVGSDEVERSKPHPDGIIEACARLGVATADAAYVGDAPNDLEAARRSRALALAAAWGHQYRPDEPADGVLQRPGDLLAYVAT